MVSPERLLADACAHQAAAGRAGNVDGGLRLAGASSVLDLCLELYPWNDSCFEGVELLLAVYLRSGSCFGCLDFFWLGLHFALCLWSGSWRLLAVSMDVAYALPRDECLDHQKRTHPQTWQHASRRN